MKQVGLTSKVRHYESLLESLFNFQGLNPVHTKSNSRKVCRDMGV